MKHLLQAKNNSLFSNSLFIFLIRFFPSVAYVLVVIFFSRQLDTASYGMYQRFWTHLFVLSAVACMGVQTFTLTYSPATISALLRRLNRVFYIGFSGWLLVVSGLFAWLQYRQLGLGVWYPFLFLLVYALTIVGESFLIVFKKFQNLVWANLLHTLAFCALHALLLANAISWAGLFLGLLLLFVLKLLFFAWQTYRQLASHTDTEQLESLKGYRVLWLHLGAYDISQILFRWVDKFIISLLVGQELFAIYHNGSIDIPFLSLLLGAVGGAGLIRLAEKDINKDETALLFANRAGRLLSCIVLPLFFFFVCFRYELFSVVLTSKYTGAVPIFLMSVLAIPLRSYSFTTILQNRHKGSIINTGAIFDLLLALILMYPFYLLMGLPGVALSFVISSYLQAGYYLYHTAALLGVPVLRLIPLRNWILKLIVFAATFITFHYFISMYFEQLIALFWGGILALLVIVVSFWLEYRKLPPL